MTRISLGILALSLGCCLAFSPSQASASHVSCGDTITADTTLDGDLVSCPGNGILIGADNITLDLNGHTVAGDDEPVLPCETPFRCDVGVLNDGHDGVSIRHGSVKMFDDGVSVMDARDVSVVGISSSENRFDGIAFFDSAQSLVRDSSASDNVRPYGTGMSMYESHHIRVLHNSFRDNATWGLTTEGSNNLISRNVASGHSRDGIAVFGGSNNRVRRNRLEFNRSGIFVASRSNVIARNRISRPGEGSFEGMRVGVGITIEGTRNRVARNVIAHARTAGIRLEWQRGPVADNIVRHNLVKKSRGDGFDVRRNNALLSHNIARRARDDGFDVRGGFTKLTGNRAVRNGDLGIEAAKGVRDGGGNTAHGNGDPAQCKNVACK
jgi:parallel beta-helix repeat protein